MSEIFGNLDDFLENYDEHNLSSISTQSGTGSGVTNKALSNDDSRRKSTNTAARNNNKTVKRKTGGSSSRNNRNNSATTSAVTLAEEGSVLASSTPAQAPSVVDLTGTSLLSTAEEMQLLYDLFQSIFNSKNPLVKELIKNRQAGQIKRSFTTLNNSYHKKPPVTANEVRKLNQKIHSVRNNLNQLDQTIKSTLQPVSRRMRNADTQLHPPIVISLDCDDDPIPTQTHAHRGNGRVTRRSRTNASIGGGFQSDVLILSSDDETLPECDGEQLNNSSNANNSFETLNYVMRIKVKWGTGIEIFEHRRFQKFADIIAKLAERESADSTYVFLNLDDRIVYPQDTPDSINYKANQFISGRILKSKAPTLAATLAPSASNNNNTITLKIQMETRRKPLQLQIGKQQTMSVLVVKCAEELKCEPKDIKLYFDGELVENSSKPEDLDLEGDEILDIRFAM